jgi:UrcA family protein
MSPLRKTSALAIAVLFTAGGPSFASAAQTGQRIDADSVTVRYADRDLDTAQGIASFYARLQSAARTVCSRDMARSVVHVFAWRNCYDQALREAVDSVASEELKALHRESSKQRKLS